VCNHTEYRAQNDRPPAATSIEGSNLLRKTIEYISAVQTVLIDYSERSCLNKVTTGPHFGLYAIMRTDGITIILEKREVSVPTLSYAPSPQPVGRNGIAPSNPLTVQQGVI